MTPDTWDRRNIPVNDGYNNPEDDVVITPTYNSGTNEITVSADRPFFGEVEVESIVATTEDGPTTLNEGSGFTTSSPTAVVVANASDLGDLLEQLDFYGEPNALGQLRRIWVGYLSISATGPIVTSASANGGGEFTIVGDRWDSAVDGAVDRVIVNFTDASSEDYYDPSGPNAGLNPGGSSVGVFNENGVTIDDGAVVGKTIASIGLQDFLGNYFLTFDIIDVPIT